MKLCISTSCLGPDIAHVLDQVDEMELKYIDLRHVWNKDIADISDQEARDIQALIKNHGVTVACISSLVFFRLPLRETEEAQTILGSYREHLEKLKRVIELAKFFDAPLVRCFTFYNEIYFGAAVRGRSLGVWETILERFAKPVRLAEAAGVTLAVESCPFTNTGTGMLVRKLVQDLDSHNVGILWDPLNSYTSSGEPPHPYEYEQIKDDIAYIDIKDKFTDRRINFNEACQLGQGNKVAWPPILQSLIKDRYQGILSLETTYVPEGKTREEGTREAHRILKEMLIRAEGAVPILTRMEAALAK